MYRTVSFEGGFVSSPILCFLHCAACFMCDGCSIEQLRLQGAWLVCTTDMILGRAAQPAFCFSLDVFPSPFHLFPFHFSRPSFLLSCFPVDLLHLPALALPCGLLILLSVSVEGVVEWDVLLTFRYKTVFRYRALPLLCLRPHSSYLPPPCCAARFQALLQSYPSGGGNTLALYYIALLTPHQAAAEPLHVPLVISCRCNTSTAQQCL
jgi:hypothetical protein